MEGDLFCIGCGASLSRGEIVAPSDNGVSSSSGRTVTEREKSLELCGKLQQHFSKVSAEWDALYDIERKMQMHENSYSEPIRPGVSIKQKNAIALENFAFAFSLLLGIPTIVYICFYLMVIFFPLIDGTEGIASGKWMILFTIILLVAAGLSIFFIVLQKKAKKKKISIIQKNEEEYQNTVKAYKNLYNSTTENYLNKREQLLNRISANYREYYEQNGLPPVGPEYCDPRKLNWIGKIILDGRASNFEKALNIMEQETQHSETLEVLEAQISAMQAVKEATMEVVNAVNNQSMSVNVTVW